MIIILPVLFLFRNDNSITPIRHKAHLAFTDVSILHSLNEIRKDQLKSISYTTFMTLLKTLILCSVLILIKSGLLQAQDISYTFEETVRIGDSNEFDENYSFAFPYYIAVGEEGWIYVSDRRLNEIRIFDAEGTFINKIGERGRGPGEFTEISTMYIDPSQNHLIVVDRMNLRVSRFDNNGKHLETHLLPEGPVISPWLGRAGDEGNHYLLYRIPVMPNQPRPEEDHLVHVYDSDFSEKTGSLIEASLYGNLDNYVIDRSIGGPSTGLFEFIKQNRLVGAPHFYDGFIYLFEKHQNEWVNTKRLQGKQPSGEIITEVDANDPPRYAVRMGTPRGAIAYLKLSTSIGLHPVDDNFLAHYVHFQDKSHENGEIGVSLFDLSTDTYLGYTKIEELSRDHEEPGSTGWNIQVKYATDNKIYFVDNRYGEPHVVVAEIEFEYE